MDKVFTSLAVSVDGFITGRDPGPGHGLGDGGILFGWYGDGDTPSQLFPGFRLFEPSRSVFDDLAGRVGSAHRGQPPPGATRGDGQADLRHFHRSRHRDRSRRGWRSGHRGHGGGVVTAALRAGLLDEVILHQVSVLLGHGRRFFQELPAHIGLSLVEAVPAPGVTHLRYRIEK